MPAYIYLWPDLLGYLLQPLLDFQNNTDYTNEFAFATQDLGLFSAFLFFAFPTNTLASYNKQGLIPMLQATLVHRARRSSKLPT